MSNSDAWAKFWSNYSLCNIHFNSPLQCMLTVELTSQQPWVPHPGMIPSTVLDHKLPLTPWLKVGSGQLYLTLWSYI